MTTAGVRIRLTGQDTGRGTFSHRHAILHDQTDGHTFVPLQHLAPEQSPVDIINSPLCETGALGFEYGYSLDCPKSLVLWEAQFGDFVNAAQVIIDQFITSAETKWRRLSGLVLLLTARIRGHGAGTFQRAVGKISHARGGGQHSNRPADHACTVFSCIAAAGGSQLAETVDCLYAKKSFASSQSHFNFGKLRPPEFFNACCPTIQNRKM